MNNPFIMLGAILLGILLMSFLELIAPAEKGHSIKGKARNLIYMIMFHTLGVAGYAVIYFIFYPAPVIKYSPSGVELMLSVLANLLLIDFMFYWYHRAEHKFKVLWPLHELHHSEGELNATTSYRTYWLEMPMQTIMVTFPTVLFFGGMGELHALMVFSLGSFFLVFAHSNLKLHLGWASILICGPQVHRIHHSELEEHRDKNFAQIFPVLDKIFGTYHSPNKGEFPRTGTEFLKSNESIIRTTIRPFILWVGMVKNFALRGR